MQIHGCSALITGAASGLGLATATALHDAGGSVLLFDLPGAPGEDIVAALGGRAAFVAGDVTQAGDVHEAPRDEWGDCSGIRSGLGCGWLGVL